MIAEAASFLSGLACGLVLLVAAWRGLEHRRQAEQDETAFHLSGLRSELKRLSRENLRLRGLD